MADQRDDQDKDLHHQDEGAQAFIPDGPEGNVWQEDQTPADGFEDHELSEETDDGSEVTVETEEDVDDVGEYEEEETTEETPVQKKSMMLPVAAAVTGILFVGSMLYVQFSGSLAPQKAASPMTDILAADSANKANKTPSKDKAPVPATTPTTDALLTSQNGIPGAGSAVPSIENGSVSEPLTTAAALTPPLPTAPSMPPAAPSVGQAVPPIPVPAAAPAPTPAPAPAVPAQVALPIPPATPAPIPGLPEAPVAVASAVPPVPVPPAPAKAPEPALGTKPSEKLDLPKPADLVKTDVAKADNAKADPFKTDVAAANAGVKTEAPKVEPVKAEPVKVVNTVNEAALNARIDSLQKTLDQTTRQLNQTLDQTTRQLNQMNNAVTNMQAAAAPVSTGSDPVLVERLAKLEQLLAAKEKEKAAVAKEISAAPVSTGSDPVLVERLAKLEQLLAAKEKEKAAVAKATEASAAVVTAAATPVAPTPVYAEKPTPIKTEATKKSSAKEVSKKEIAKKRHAEKNQKIEKQSFDDETSSRQGGWVLRAATPDAVWVAKSMDSSKLRQVEVGQSLPGIGTVRSIQQAADGKWEVVGSKGTLK